MKYLSPSSLKAYVDCARYAVLSSLGLRKGSTKAQQRGTDLHLAVYKYLIGKTPKVEDVLGDIARTNGFLPEPGSKILVEYGIGEANKDAERYAETEEWTGLPVVVHGTPFRGIVDLIRLDRGRVEIWDHKTTSGWYYVETAETLRQNLQIWAYAEQVIQWLEHESGRPYTGVVLMGHIQYRKCKTPKADDVREVHFTTSRAEVGRKWKLIENIAGCFIDDSEKFLIDIERNTSHCKAYGGCAHAPFCSLLKRPSLVDDMSRRRAVDAWKLDF